MNITKKIALLVTLGLSTIAIAHTTQSLSSDAKEGKNTMTNPIQQNALSGKKTSNMVNINTADVNELSQKLKGVGLKKAQLIVAYREQFGKFKSIEELTKVKGIGKGTIAQNINIIILE